MQPAIEQKELTDTEGDRRNGHLFHDNARYASRITGSKSEGIKPW